jgi:hypothetical protein
VNKSSACRRILASSVVAFGCLLATVPSASAQPDGPAAPDPGQPMPVQADVANSPDANPVAVQACNQFGDVLDATASYYGDFADALDDTASANYADPAVSDSNVVGRTALRQGAGVAMDSANLPGLQPEIANPMRSWSFSATKLLIKMGLRNTGPSLDTTANEMNNDATAVQAACAAAGTHA